MADEPKVRLPFSKLRPLEKRYPGVVMPKVSAGAGGPGPSAGSPGSTETDPGPNVRPPGADQPFSGERIRALRARTGLSQAAFAKAYQIALRTLCDWEQEARTPAGPAAALLTLIEVDPTAARRALATRAKKR